MQLAKERRPSGRILELDGLRGLAVLAVIAFHYTEGTHWANPVTGLGWVGVDLFFVLSGFLITGILVNSRGRPRYFSNFYARRSLRIFPVYYLLLAVYVGAAWLGGGRQPWAYWAMHAAFLSATLEHFHYWAFAAPAFVYAGVTVLWSLSIEEQFYLLWAPIVRWLRPQALWAFLGALILGAPILRYCLHTPGFTEYRFLPTRFDSLAWGAALALVARNWEPSPSQGRRSLRALAWGAGGILAAVLAATGGLRESRWFALTGYTALAALFTAAVGGAVIGAGSEAWACRGLRFHPLQHLGKISYAVYLIHYPILTLVAGWVEPGLGSGSLGLAVRDLVSFGMAIGLATLSWKLLEAPAAGLKERWAPALGKHPELKARPVRIAELPAGAE